LLFIRKENYGSEISSTFVELQNSKFGSMLDQTLKADEKLSQNVKEIKAKKLEEERQLRIEKQNQVKTISSDIQVRFEASYDIVKHDL